MGKKKSKGGEISSSGQAKLAFEKLMKFSPNMQKECIVELSHIRDVKIIVIDFKYNKKTKIKVEIRGKLRTQAGVVKVKFGNGLTWSATGNFDGVVISAAKCPKTMILKNGERISYEGLYDYACRLPIKSEVVKEKKTVDKNRKSAGNKKADLPESVKKYVKQSVLDANNEGPKILGNIYEGYINRQEKPLSVHDQKAKAIQKNNHVKIPVSGSMKKELPVAPKQDNHRPVINPAHKKTINYDPNTMVPIYVYDSLNNTCSTRHSDEISSVTLKVNDAVKEFIKREVNVFYCNSCDKYFINSDTLKNWHKNKVFPFVNYVLCSNSFDFNDYSMLSLLGYSVKADGMSEKERRSLLRRIIDKCK